MGGVDVQTTIGFGNYDLLKTDIKKIFTTFSKRGILLRTSHFVQDRCSIEELTFAFDLINKLNNL